MHASTHVTNISGQVKVASCGGQARSPCPSRRKYGIVLKSFPSMQPPQESFSLIFLRNFQLLSDIKVHLVIKFLDLNRLLSPQVFAAYLSRSSFHYNGPSSWPLLLSSCRKWRIINTGCSFLKQNFSRLVLLVKTSPEGNPLFQHMALPLMVREVPRIFLIYDRRKEFQVLHSQNDLTPTAKKSYGLLRPARRAIEPEIA